jgi:MurNAc alpha-1-phosphate uridylyltransferase
MVLAAGLGTRMRPVTDAMPKPLVPVAGKPLLDHVLDKLADAGVGDAVVNVHYFAEQIEQHLAGRRVPRITISDERSQLLNTGGASARSCLLSMRAPRC